ncbi:hypothetical protein F0P96_19130 [Hymenobacter busanensis]|uniref:Uncharacterized protein n=1 Tax=Hymenobacter busanensis TaxID=2607656 RepID=A0A7L4ZT35_9BACT|nr:hypothetical protein [Hymenobacter busanensis]KAA9325879.1 hypothetical protein F0P96_19130 [Hymenobacter busanensis]QHJ06281.1 hypothetical protein GUY19_02795 [Hymenobacter busanensis]
METTLVRLLPVALGFLAKWLNLDGISGAIQTGLKKVQAPVERALTQVLHVVAEEVGVSAEENRLRILITG